MKRKKKRGFSASYTVEASAVVPLLLALVLLLVIGAFVLHDRTVLQADTIGRAFGKERKAGALFVTEPALFSEESSLTKKIWNGAAHYQGFSLPLLQVFWQEGRMEESWWECRMEMPDFLRLRDVLQGMQKREGKENGN